MLIIKIPWRGNRRSSSAQISSTSSSLPDSSVEGWPGELGGHKEESGSKREAPRLKANFHSQFIIVWPPPRKTIHTTPVLSRVKSAGESCGARRRGAAFYYPLNRVIVNRLQYAWPVLSSSSIRLLVFPRRRRVKLICMQIASKIVTRNWRVTFHANSH